MLTETGAPTGGTVGCSWAGVWQAGCQMVMAVGCWAWNAHARKCCHVHSMRVRAREAQAKFWGKYEAAGKSCKL